MADRKKPESVEEKNLRMIVSSALIPSAPPVSPELPAQLAARARQGRPVRFDLPLAAAGFSALGLLLLAALPLLPAQRMDLRWWAFLIPAINLVLAPFAAYIVVRNISREATHAKT
jgi:hypothetical protein